MNLQQINEILKNVTYIPGAKGLRSIKVLESDDYDDEKDQGHTGERIQIFSIDGEDELKLKLVTNTDSYGDNEHVTSIQFIKEFEVETIKLSI